MIQRRTFIQSIAAWFSSFSLFGKSTPAPVSPKPLENPTGWTITWNDLESDKSLGYWLALPQSADRDVAFRVLVARPAGMTRRVNEREVPNDAASGTVGEIAVLEGYGRRVFADDIDSDDLDWDNITPSFFDKTDDLKFGAGRKVTHYVIWDEEFIPPTPEAIEAAKQARRGRVIEMIHESQNGRYAIGNLEVVSPMVDRNGERIRIKPEGYIETVCPTPEERALAEKQQAFSENPPPFFGLMHTTFGELWHGGDYPTTITCGYLAYKTLRAQFKEGGHPFNHKFCGCADLLMSRSMKLRQVKFENSNFPADPKYNRVIEMPDEAYL